MKNLILLLLITFAFNVAKSEDGETEAMNFYGNTKEEACQVARQRILHNPNIILRDCLEVPLGSSAEGKKVLAVYKCKSKTDGNFFDCGIKQEILAEQQQKQEERLRQQQLQIEKQVESARNQELIKRYNKEQEQYKKQHWLQEQYGSVLSLVKEANFCEISLTYNGSGDRGYYVNVDCFGDSIKFLGTGGVYKVVSSDVGYKDKKLLFRYIRSRMMAAGFTLVAECRSGDYQTEFCDLQRTGNQ